MRYPPDQKAKARAALLCAGSREMKLAGFNGVGVDGLASSANVTSGAFYSNFPSKDAMLEAIVDVAVGEPFLTDSTSGTKADRRSQLKSLIVEYLSVHHVENPGDGCAMPALSADVARAPTSTREAYERKVVALADRMADLLDGRRPDRERRAWSLIALMVGAVSISRAMADPDSQIRAIESARRTAGTLVSPEEGTK